MRRIAVLNQKGGVGKTTSVVNIAAALANAGHRVAVIDMDPQSHLTIHLGIEPESVELGTYRVLCQSGSFEDEVMLVRPNLWLLPANINLVGAESELVSVVGREIILREAIEKVQDKFDYLIIDCAPSLGLLTLNALAAVEDILIPLQPHFLALQGLGKLLQTVDLINKRINRELKVKWVLLCMYDSRASLPGEVKANIISFLENARNTDCAWADAEVLPIHIRRNIKLAEAPSYGNTIFEYSADCHGAQDYSQVADYISGKLSQQMPGEENNTIINQQDESAVIQQEPLVPDAEFFNPTVNSVEQTIQAELQNHSGIEQNKTEVTDNINDSITEDVTDVMTADEIDNTSGSEDNTVPATDHQPPIEIQEIPARQTPADDSEQITDDNLA